MRPLQLGKPSVNSSMVAMPDRGGVATGQQRRPGRRTQRGGVKLRQPHAAFGDPRHGGHLDQTAEAVPGRDAGVIPHQIEDVRRILRRGRRRVRTPVRLRIANIQLDLAVKFRRPRHKPPASLSWWTLSRTIAVNITRARYAGQLRMSCRTHARNADPSTLGVPGEVLWPILRRTTWPSRESRRAASVWSPSSGRVSIKRQRGHRCRRRRSARRW